MKFDEFSKSMLRILAFYKHPHTEDERKEARDYADATYEIVKFMSPFSFDQVTKELVGELNSFKKPMPNIFMQCYRRLNRNECMEGDTSCPFCMGTGMTQDWIKKQKTGEVWDAVRHCTRCNPKTKNWSTKPGHVSIQKADYDAVLNSIACTETIDDRPEV